MAADYDKLLDALGVAPDLRGAACRGRSTVFDDQPPGTPLELVTERTAQAVAACRACPALERCSTWLAGLPPSQRPGGVVAGRPTPAGGAALRAGRRERIAAALRLAPHLDSRAHGRQLGVSDAIVREVRGALESANEIPRIRGQGGRPRTRRPPDDSTRNTPAARRRRQIQKDCTREEFTK